MLRFFDDSYVEIVELLDLLIWISLLVFCICEVIGECILIFGLFVVFVYVDLVEYVSWCS